MYTFAVQIVRNDKYIFLQDEIKSVGDNWNPTSSKNMVSCSLSTAIIHKSRPSPLHKANMEDGRAKKQRPILDQTALR